jgi:hypothetical protein
MSEHDVLIGRLERSARLAVNLAASHRQHRGEPRTAFELEAFADLFKLTASTLRTIGRDRLVEAWAPDPGEPR